ncbi:hypothetical protein ABT008_08845 [Micromonospora sp. NPDC002389]|uniref:hypothetical protein n=1 Tax=Micromonospora sp. NPDC002389 TaxID=3154272 RepID=UPI0033299237
MIVEIHVPLVAAPGRADEDGFPWIDEVDDLLVDLEDDLGIEVYDDGEEFGDAYVFFVTGADEATLLTAARRVAALDGVPPGVVAVVTDDEAGEMGTGRRVDPRSA